MYDPARDSWNADGSEMVTKEAQSQEENGQLMGEPRVNGKGDNRAVPPAPRAPAKIPIKTSTNAIMTDSHQNNENHEQPDENMRIASGSEYLSQAGVHGKWDMTSEPGPIKRKREELPMNGKNPQSEKDESKGEVTRDEMTQKRESDTTLEEGQENEGLRATKGFRRPSRKSEADHARQEKETRRVLQNQEKRLQNEPVRQHYNERPNHSRDTRNLSPIIELKNFNNLIKSLLIERLARRRDRVLDIGCGKGGDLGKWARHGISAWTGIDIADQSIEHARDRLSKIRAKFSSSLYVADPFTEDIHDVVRPRELPVDIVSSQFALHYAYGSEETIRQLLKNVSSALVPKGVFLGTIPDSDVMFRQLQNLKQRIDNDSQGPYEWGNEVYKVVFDELPPDEAYVNNKSPYGHRYTFFLKDAVGNVPEFIVPFDQFQGLCEEYGLRLKYKKNFGDFYESERIKRPQAVNRLYQGMFRTAAPAIKYAIPPDQLEAAEIYTVFVFEKD